jgi:hypothetical protein
LVIYLNCTMMHGVTNLTQFYILTIICSVGGYSFTSNSSVGLLIQKLQQFALSVTVQWLVAQVEGSDEECAAERTLPAVYHRGMCVSC